jgi:hypothetical protein
MLLECDKKDGMKKCPRCKVMQTIFQKLKY